MKKNMYKNKNRFIEIIVFLFIILMCILIYVKFKKDNNPIKILEEQKSSIFSVVDKNTNVNITKYTVYGTHFNLEGTLDIIKVSGITVNYVDLIIKNLNGEEIRNIFRF